MNLELIGYEKISDKDKRLSKVNQLKDKIRTELKDIRKSEMHILNTFNMTKLAYKECIFTLFITYAIEDFIDAPDVFMRANSTYFDDDIIIYTTHIYHINLMLDSKFNFCRRVLTHLCAQKDSYYYMGDVLNEKNIVTNIISVFDEMEYDNKQSKEDNSTKESNHEGADIECPCKHCDKISVDCIYTGCKIFKKWEKVHAKKDQKQTMTHFEKLKTDIQNMTSEFVEKYYDDLDCLHCVYDRLLKWLESGIAE